MLCSPVWAGGDAEIGNSCEAPFLWVIWGEFFIFILFFSGGGRGRGKCRSSTVYVINLIVAAGQHRLRLVGRSTQARKGVISGTLGCDERAGRELLFSRFLLGFCGTSVGLASLSDGWSRPARPSKGLPRAFENMRTNRGIRCPVAPSGLGGPLEAGSIASAV
jgi:hypothetical protein